MEGHLEVRAAIGERFALCNVTLDGDYVGGDASGADLSNLRDESKRSSTNTKSTAKANGESQHL